MTKKQQSQILGAVGNFGFHGEMDLAIASRAGLIKGKQLHAQAAVGIAADFEFSFGWTKMLNKVSAVLRVAELVVQRLHTRVA